METASACKAGRWHGCSHTFTGPLLKMLVGPPLPALLAGVLARIRWAAGVTTAWRISPAEVGMVYGTAPIVRLTPATRLAGRRRLIPLRDRATMGPIGIYGNLLIFAAPAVLPRI